MGRSKKGAPGRVAFIALAPEIYAELKLGRTKLDVYRQFEGRLNMTYAGFTYWIRKFEKLEKKTAVYPPSQTDLPRGSAPVRVLREPKRYSPPEPRGFRHDPMAALNKKALSGDD